MKNRLFLDVHAIQTLPPANINRDDTGSPKTAQYGGVRRARVSSQSWKRAMRRYFNEFGEEKNLGVRTLYVPAYVAKIIRTLDSSITEEDAMKKAIETLNKGKVKINKEGKTSALFFIGETQAKELARVAINGEANEKEIKQILKNNPAMDIALFGRMVADDPKLNEDASSQVAHAISTHAVETEFDYFTATDDHSPNEHAGAGMIGTVEFNSSTLYRYANVAIHEFSKQLGQQKSVLDALALYIEAFIKSLPTGKVNTFANQTLPDAVLITLRTDRPLNLVTAFEKPLRSREGFTRKSIEKLVEESNKIEKMAGESRYKILLSLEEVGTEGVELAESIDELLQKVTEKLSELKEVE